MGNDPQRTVGPALPIRLHQLHDVAVGIRVPGRHSPGLSARPMKDWNVCLDKSSVHRLKVLHLESNVCPVGMSFRGARVDGEVEIAIPPGVFVMAAPDPGIAWPPVITGLEWNAQQFTVETG